MTRDERTETDYYFKLEDAHWALETPACWRWPLPSTTETDDPEGGLGAMSAWQAGRCAICGYAERTMVQDHDHETALIRGWLCRSCNVTEGRGDGGRFVRYRLINPATIFGVEERYVDLFGQEAVPNPWPTPEEFVASLPESVWTVTLEDLDDRPISALRLWGLEHLAFDQSEKRERSGGSS